MAKSIHHARVLIKQRHIRYNKLVAYTLFARLLVTSLFILLFGLALYRVGRQVVNVPSFMVRIDSQKHIDFSLTSPFGGCQPGRVKRKNQKAAAKNAVGGDADEDDEE
ncbi:hypothetical protein M8C21_022968 [Ambrosia artemisiifolia]|uniref:Transmembrane protein n=1 Tax=Ambrosia artemisiifolia TaxID=4212 RepID=A0AAD5DC28_AMBAR|nr:hypothetical protein M8C21_022968 [Ambrosia artemisiifolia]